MSRDYSEPMQLYSVRGFTPVRYIFNDSEMALGRLFCPKCYHAVNEKNGSVGLEIDFRHPVRSGYGMLSDRRDLLKHLKCTLRLCRLFHSFCYPAIWKVRQLVIVAQIAARGIKCIYKI